MAIPYITEKKRQRLFIVVFILVTLTTIFVLWQFYFKKQKPPLVKKEIPVGKKIVIDFTVLENPLLKELQIFEEIKPFKETLGRKTPFLPY
jgi:hypothetical protein